jgi:hypothetical protein
MSTAAQALWIPPRPKPEILETNPALVAEYCSWFVNRRAYTRQSDRPNPDNNRYYYFQPKERETKKRLALTDNTVRLHLSGAQTIGLYAITPETQRSKWVAIDADYTRAHRDLAALKLELKEDGVEAALEMSRRGAHLWILCDEPLPAKTCRVYIYNLALRLGVPIKGTLNQVDGIEIFPRQDELREGEFGNAIRGPLGIHRANMHRYWFEDAAPNFQAQFAYLRQLKRLTAEELATFTEGLSIPEEFLSRPRFEQPISILGKGKGFQILEHVQVRRKSSGNWWTRCPSCEKQGHDKSGDNLAISVASPQFYKCWAGCTREMIREALGFPIRQR